MIKIKDFKPDSETEAGLKDQISFRFSELSNSPLSADQIPSEQQLLPPEGQHQFISLSDEEIVEILDSKSSKDILFYNSDSNISSSKNKVSVLLPKATSDQVVEELQRISPIREQIRQNISYLARISYPSDPIQDPQQKQAINFYNIQDQNIIYTLATKGKVLDVFNTTKDYNTLYPSKAFTGFIQPTAQLSYTRVLKAINPGLIGKDNPITKIGWVEGSIFKLLINQDLTIQGVGQLDNMSISDCYCAFLNQAFVIQSARLVSIYNQFFTEIFFDTKLSFIKINNNLQNENSQILQDSNSSDIVLDGENYFINNDSSFGKAQASTTKPKIIVNNYNAISNSPILSLIFPAGTFNSSGNIRDLIFCTIEQIQPYETELNNQQLIPSSKGVVALTPSTYSPIVNNSFFNQQELLGINGNGSVVDGKLQGRDVGSPLFIDLVLAVSGYPILVGDSVSKLAFSLTKVNQLIQSEIPQTRIYKPVVGIEEFSLIGNLQKDSVCIFLHDDGNEIPLVTNGKANPGCSVEFKLATDPQNHYDVQTTITLFAPSIKIPILGPASQGVNAIKVAVDLISSKSTAIPDDSSLGSKNQQQKVVTQSEFYFNKNATANDNKKINLNSYGTIRIFDAIKIFEKNQDGTFFEIEKNIVKGVLEKENLIILSSPLSKTITPTSNKKYYVEIPQTPLNPNRNYKVVVLAKDRGGNIV